MSQKTKKTQPNKNPKQRFDNFVSNMAPSIY